MRFLLFALVLSFTSSAHAQSPEPSAAMIDPLTIARTGQPNDALACPPDRCATEPTATSPEFLVPAGDLFRFWLETVRAEPRTTVTAEDEAEFLMNAEQRSRVLGFVDTIAARVLPLDDQRSTIAVYSRSNIGYWDIGVNDNRLTDWLAALTARVGSSTN